MKNFFTRKEFQLDELLFENRNQAYGAYNLRHEADEILTKSMFVGVILFAAISATPFIINSFKSEIIDKQKIGDNYVFEPIEIIDVTPPPAEVLPQMPQAATTVYTIPVPAVAPAVQTSATAQSTLKDNNIGTVETIGAPPTATFTPPVLVGPPAPTPVIPKPVNNSPAVKVDVEAKFATGIDGFRTSMMQNFNTNSFDGVDNIVRTKVTFIVEKDGSISDVKAIGANADFNKEAVKTIKSIRGKWTPAKLNGELVRSYFSFPVSMKFE